MTDTPSNPKADATCADDSRQLGLEVEVTRARDQEDLGTHHLDHALANLREALTRSAIGTIVTAYPKWEKRITAMGTTWKVALEVHLERLPGSRNRRNRHTVTPHGHGDIVAHAKDLAHRAFQHLAR
ncbi:MAG: hypothetical protein K0S68_163 [Candidatus Saccharibacteria bacterium]|nr:hypothetical protein [Candidatus Saccharibacteria bacterium]